MKIKEIVKIGIDIFEFLKYVKIQEPGQLKKEYELWPFLVDLHREMEGHSRIDIIKSKKIGVTWAVCARAVWLIYTRPGWRVLVYSKGRDYTKEIIDRCRVIYRNLPSELQVFRCEPDAAESFGFMETVDGRPWGSVIVSYPSTPDAGIGEDAGTVFHDEADFHEYWAINHKHSSATVRDTVGGQIINVSTVDWTKTDSDFVQHWKDARDGKNGYRALFYGWDVRPGRDEEFYRQIERENENEPWVTQKNYPRTIEDAITPIKAISCFKPDILQELSANASEPIEVRQGYINIFYPPQVGTQYIAGIDVGEGVGLDYSVMVIVGKRGLNAEVVAVIYTNEVGTDSFAYECDKLGREYYNCLINFDNIGVGRAVADKLQELGYPRLYRELDKEGKPKKLGYAMTKPNKYVLTTKLVELVNSRKLVTKFKPMIKEMEEYQWIKGNPTPTGRTHADTITALQLVVAIWDKVGGGDYKPSLYVRGEQIW